MKKKIIALVLCLTLFISLGTFISATALQSDKNSEFILPATENISEFRRIGAEILEDEDLFISEEVAYCIAQYFVRDIVASQTTSWNAETHIVKTTIMYDDSGDNITAYTFELDKGYIVVSAYIDATQLIPEWSDVGQPVYKSLNLDADDKVIFLSVFDYFVDNGTDTLNSIYGDKVARSDITNIFEAARSIDNIRSDLLVDVVEKETLEETNKENATLFGGIVDPYAHAAATIYGESWTPTEWANNWESYANFATMNLFSGYSNHCGPTAITNLIKMYGNKYNKSTIKNATNANVFAQVIAANNAHYPRYYTSTDGTFWDTEDDFIKDSFARYNVTVYTYGRYSATFQNIKNCTSATNKLMYLDVTAESYYGGNHAVVGYAYNRLQNNNYSSIWYSYVKISDGWDSAGRYLYIGDLVQNSSAFTEVYF